jgi:hypothetical protein
VIVCGNMENSVKSFLKESLSYRLASKAAAVWRASLSRKMLGFIAAIIRNSCIYRSLARFFHEPFKPEQAAVYRFLQRLDDLLLPLRTRVALIVKNSAAARIMRDSTVFRLSSSLLAPSAAFFVFFDEIGRDIFGSNSIFALWDEAYLLLGLLYVSAIRLMETKKRRITATPLDMPILPLISASFFLFMINSPDPAVGFEGMRVVVQFILWFFVFRGYIDSERKAMTLIRGLVWCGGILAVHGIAQYVMGVETPAGWTDLAEGSASRRIFSIVESPNILGSILALTIPSGISMMAQKGMKACTRAIYTTFTACMAACMILTLSRGAWVGLIVGLAVFCMLWNPGWLPGLFAGAGAALLIPAVSNRILYMMSPQYLESSLTGGRLLRYSIGWEMFRNNLVKGVGLGRFGGAVAMNHKDMFPDTFYMDNYWLKTAVEMGIIGIAAFFVLMLFLAVWSIRAVNRIAENNRKLLAAGCVSGMAGVLIHNFFENVFEVPYMVVYFWMVAAVVMYLGFGNPLEEDRQIP